MKVLLNLVLKKCRKNPENILFTDESQNFEKVKTQNILKDKDIDRIVNAYKERKNIDKYAYVASLKEVEENDYNLNIPRYVDTFEKEEEIDIAAIAKELADLETDMVKTDATIAEFCQELGIDVPFSIKEDK